MKFLNGKGYDVCIYDFRDQLKFRPCLLWGLELVFLQHLLTVS